MLSIHDGRNAFYQWDTWQKLRVQHPGKICEVHYKNPGEETALVVGTYDLDGQTVADVPNILLQEAGKLTAYVYICAGDACTIDKTTFDVKPRQKPADYVYTETEIKTYTALENRLEALEKGCTYGAENAGALLYIGPDGAAIPLKLGDGLEIKDGVLTLTHSPAPAPDNTTAALGRAILGKMRLGMA